MKYISKYKLFESSNTDIVKEICYDITDSGKFEVKVRDSHSNKKEVSVLFISRTHRTGDFQRMAFYFNEIKDIVYRIKDAIGIDKIRGLYILISHKKEYDKISYVDLDNETIENYNMVSLYMSFYK